MANAQTSRTSFTENFESEIRKFYSGHTLSSVNNGSNGPILNIACIDAKT